GPNAAQQLLPSHGRAAAFQQCHEDVDGFWGELDALVAAEQQPSPGIEPEAVEAIDMGGGHRRNLWRTGNPACLYGGQTRLSVLHQDCLSSTFHQENNNFP